MKLVIIITILFVFLFIPINAYESVSDLKNNFESSMIEILLAELTDKDLEDWKIFLGEESYQKLQEFNTKYNAEYNSETLISSEIDMNPSLDEEIFIAEIAESELKFFKQKMSEQIMKIENLFENVKRQINESDFSNEEKFQHINEIEEKKIEYLSEVINEMKDFELMIDEINQKKKELQLELDLREQLLELGIEICPPGTTIGMRNEMVFCYSPIDLENTCPVGTQPFFDNQGNLICRYMDENQLVDLNTEIITDSQTGGMILDDNSLYSIGIGSVALMIILGFYQFEKHKW